MTSQNYKLYWRESFEGL